MKLSERMEAVTALLTPGNVLADVGTDHGYVPIALVERGQIPRAIAMDLREGPLAHARGNIAECGMSGLIETRLSDGVEALQPGEADSVVIAGMGGELVVHILQRGENVCKSVKELILQPQSELQKVRTYLCEHGYHITEEDMVCEDGKYYPMMRVIPKEEEVQVLSEVQALYGPVLLTKRHPVLQQFLKKEQKQLKSILAGLKAQEKTEKIQKRIEQVQQKLVWNAQALRRMEQGNEDPAQ